MRGSIEMQGNPLVTVVIPVYRVERYLEKSVLSVINQSYKNIEIILVDDGSPDNCPKICDDFASKYDNIKVIHKVNGGLSDARNAGIDLVRGDYLLFLDSDDTLSEDAIEGLVGKALESKADVVIPDRYIQIVENESKTVEKLHFDDTCHIEDPTSFVINVMIGKGRAWRFTALLYRTEIIKHYNVRFPVGRVSEDFVFNINYMKYAKKIAFYRKSTLYNLKRAGSITNTFHDNMEQTYLFIDDEICKFFKDKSCKGDFDTKRKELLCRNIITYITSIFSLKSPLKIDDRYRKANEILDNDRIKEAFNVSEISPYFNSQLIIIYYKIMFRLIKANRRKVAFMLARLTGKVSRWLK